ncbi:ATP-dependent endonuclease [Bordetella genomosp. 1]|uniref:ATP-dependent endonuclease n=1 Tax=Bordetella genomosp. 1 TaxID=1395607 RepID=A0ABX4F260_9BORD|nr:ATP-dependent endonuclease [Bordetella genomosp. 1]OZI66101.1 ATP-dependent endonuclease [Bordetella genomosp. 1]
MRLQAYRLQNYRRLRDVVIELDDKISIFVGANNSGKTSAVQGLFSLLRGDAKRFELFDFSAALWPGIDEAGEPIPDEGGEQKSLPSISLDMWFRVGEQDLVAAMPLLPSTDWDGKCVGVRVAFEPKNQDELFHRFRDLRGKCNEAAKALAEKAAKAKGAAGAVGTDFSDYKPWPESLTKYLTKALATEYTFRYYVLDEREFEGYREKNVDYSPLSIAGDKERGGAAVIKSLLKVDFLRAQRHLDDPDEGTSSRSENLSRKLSRFYQRHLEKRGDDHQALQALDASEKGLNFHLQEVFKDTLDRLKKLGYPGVNNPDIVIRAALEPSTVLGQDAKVHYVVPGNVPAHLPDSYNGLGFKNLVYMVVELLDLHERWNRDEAERAPLHLVFIEEPEAHLHAQIQQVFIRNVLKLLEEDKEDQDSFFHTQLVVTTHSPHILYERGFSPIRYFRRVSAELEHHTDVRNLSRFKAGDTEKEAREFLQRYLKLTHCDLFFSDAAVLVEGNVERLLMPAMIETAAPRLRSSALTILEVGGAFAHRFQELIEFVGLTTLVVTDLDSVEVKEDAAADVGADEDEDELRPFEVEEDGEGDGGEKATSKKRGSTCHAHVPHAVTANQTLISWLPKKHSVDELWKAPPEQKVLALASATDAHVRVAYQTPIPVTVEGNTVERCGRTLEEAFGLENAAWCQAAANRPIGLKLRKAATTPEELALGLHKRVVSRSFDKTRFALEVLASGPLNQWRVPTYISEGLVWLEERVAHEQEAEVAVAAGAAAIEPVNDGAFLVEAGAAQ